MKKISAAIGFFVIVIMVYYYIKLPMIVPDQQVSEISKDSDYITHAKKFDALQNRNEPHKPLGFDPKSSASMDKYWNDRFDTNVTLVTNIFKSGTNGTRAQITSRSKNKQFGTDDWELFSKIHFQNDCELDPGQSQILDILTEYPAARDSSRLFTGAYGATFLLYNIRNEVRKLIEDEIRVENRIKTRLNGVNDLDENIRARIRRDNERHQEQCLRCWQGINEDKEEYWAVLKELYGDFPKDLFQRLMAVEYQGVF
jgi:hypothetical protein